MISLESGVAGNDPVLPGPAPGRTMALASWSKYEGAGCPGR